MRIVRDKRWQALSGCAARLLRWLAPAGLTGAVALTSGCIATSPAEWIHNGFKVGPNYCRPPAPLADAWIEAADPKVESRYLHDWWTVFQDGTLDGLIQTAYEQNVTLRVLGTRVLEARAQQAISVGNIFPQMQEMTGHYERVGLSKNAANNPTVLGPVVSAIENRLGLPPTNSAFVNFYSDWNLGFNLSWELDFWGRFRRSIETANANLDASV